MNSFFKYLSLFLNYKKELITSLVCNVLAAVFTVFSIPLLIPFFQLLFDRVPAQTDLATHTLEGWLNHFFVSLIDNTDKQSALLYVCGFIILVFFFKNVFRYLSMYFITPVRNGIVRDLRKKMYSHYLQLPLHYYKDQKKGDMIARISMDIAEIEWSILQVVQTTIKAPIIIVGSIIFMLFISAKLTLFVLVLLVFTILIIGGISRSLKKKSVHAQERLASIVSYVDESLTGIRTIRSSNVEDSRRAKFGTYNDGYKNLMDAVLRKRDMSSPVSEFLGVVVVSVLLVYGSSLVFENHLKPETFFAFIFAFYQVIEPAKSFSTAYFNIQKGRASIDRIESYFAIPKEEGNGVEDLEITDFNEAIEFQNVDFQYPDGKEKVLASFTLKIPYGSNMALIGESGCGKSTVLDLLLKFYAPTNGTIRIDGIDIQNIKNDNLRNRMAYVSQDVILFYDTVLSNITLEEEPSNYNKAVWAAKQAQAYDFIQQLPNQMETLVGQGGSKLSGGQKQRIAIARALYQDASIWLLDEVTSALDSSSEKDLLIALGGILQDKTAIIVAHKKSTIQLSDQYAIIQKGSVIETGDTDKGLQGVAPKIEYKSNIIF